MQMFKSLLALAFAASLCAACGTAPDQPAAPAEAVTATESAVVLTGQVTMQGIYTCGGVTYQIQQPVNTQGPSRRCCGLSNIYTTKLGAAGWDYGVNSTGNIQVGVSCPDLIFPLPGTGSGTYQYYSSTTNTTCYAYNKAVGASTWSYSGTVDTHLSASFLYPNFTPNGYYVLGFSYLGGGGSGVGFAGCPNAWGWLDYMFGA